MVMYKANHELYLKNLRLMEENEKLRKRVEVLQEEHQQLFSELINKLSNDGANNPNTNAPNNIPMLQTTYHCSKQHA
jgi:hypothetical protein